MDTKGIDIKKKQEIVYSWLEDDESRFIYEHKLRFNLDHNYEHIKQIMENYTPELRGEPSYLGKEKLLIDEIRKEKRRVGIFGAGCFGKKALDFCHREDFVTSQRFLERINQKGLCCKRI